MEHGIHLWRLWGIRYIEWTISWDIRQRKFCPKMTISDHAERTCDFFFLKRKLSGMNRARQEKIPQVWWDNASPAWKGIFWEALILSLLREQDGQLQRGWAMPSRLFQKHTQVFSEASKQIVLNGHESQPVAHSAPCVLSEPSAHHLSGSVWQRTEACALPGPTMGIRACPSCPPSNPSPADEAAKKIASFKICGDTSGQAWGCHWPIRGARQNCHEHSAMQETVSLGRGSVSCH